MPRKTCSSSHESLVVAKSNLTCLGPIPIPLSLHDRRPHTPPSCLLFLHTQTKNGGNSSNGSDDDGTTAQDFAGGGRWNASSSSSERENLGALLFPGCGCFDMICREGERGDDDEDDKNRELLVPLGEKMQANNYVLPRGTRGCRGCRRGRRDGMGKLLGQDSD
ncbi:hypothetical protein VTH82DRAFT_8378 [Thermothelomyces myriococcoides]